VIVERDSKSAEQRFDVTGLAGGTLHVTRFRAEEALSRPYLVEVDLYSEDPELDFASIVGQEGALVLLHTEGERAFHGIVASFEELDAERQFTRYRAVLVPRLWLLDQRRDCRIFQAMTVPDILKKVFEAASITGDALDDRLSGSYAARDYCVQYRETDIQFVQRLMEEEGIFYFFTHTKDQHVMVLADGDSGWDDLPDETEVRYLPPTTAATSAQAVHRLRYSQSVRSGKTTLRDFTFKQPTLDLEVSAEAELDTGLEVYDYPGEYVAADVGQGLVQVRLEEIQVERSTARGASDVRRLVPGARFTLADHPRADLNQEYGLVKVVHRGTQPEWATPPPGAGSLPRESEYVNEFEAMPSSVPYRPPRVTSRPTIPGVQTAVVTGPSGEEIHVDEFGRIKVQFPWDREGRFDENSSCWVRVSQGWAGAGWGIVFLPRIGQEVIVQFIEGDPDRPVVTGRVYNGDNPLPYGLPDEKNKSTIKSNTTKGGGGNNEFRFDDTAGAEEIWLHGQKDWNIVIENDKTQSIGHDETGDVGNDRTRTVGNNESVTVGNDETRDVGNNRTRNVGNDETVTIGNNETRDVGNDRTQTIGNNETLSVGVDQAEDIGSNLTLTVGANQTESVGADKAQTVSGNRTEDVSGNVTITIGGNQDETVSGNDTQTVAIAQTIAVGAAYSLAVGAAADVTVGLAFNEAVGAMKSVQVGAEYSEMIGGSSATTVGTDWSVNVGAKGVLAATDDLTMSGKNVILEGKDKLTLKCGSAEIVMDKGGDITIKGGKITVQASGDLILKGSKVAAN